MKYLIINIMIFFVSCSEIHRFLDQTSRPREQITDKRTLTYSKEENKFIQTATTGFAYVDTIYLYPGEIFRISPNTPYHLILDGIDFSVYTLFSKYNEKENYVELGVIRPTSNAIKLENQCETIRWMDSYKVPNIEVGENLEVHQIIITPIMNLNCQKMGYEIRYGSQDLGGCRSKAKEVFDRYYQCVKKNKKAPIRYNLLDIVVE